ncbi:MAG TPA: hypothetical protein VIS48_07770, partial [Candidatus Kryptonia bacterium]
MSGAGLGKLFKKSHIAEHGTIPTLVGTIFAGTLFAPPIILHAAHPQKADFRFTFPVQKQPYDERDPKERDFWVSPEGIPSGQKKVNNK